MQQQSCTKLTHHEAARRRRRVALSLTRRNFFKIFLEKSKSAFIYIFFLLLLFPKSMSSPISRGSMRYFVTLAEVFLWEVQTVITKKVIIFAFKKCKKPVGHFEQFSQPASHVCLFKNKRAKVKEEEEATKLKLQTLTNREKKCIKT